MDKYYYLVSSLPLLKFAERPFLTKEEFIIEARKWLEDADFIILSKADINNFLEHKKDIPTLKKYKKFELSLREELASYRKVRIKKVEYKIRKDLSDIIQDNKNPLEIEIGLLFLRWEFLNEEEVGHFFDLSFLIIYYLKLQILERLFSFDKEKGKERLEAYSSVEL